jgi:hypothetical protein
VLSNAFAASAATKHHNVTHVHETCTRKLKLKRGNA